MTPPDIQAGQDRLIAALIERTARPAEEVRTVFAEEYTRLAAHAKVHTHLGALAAANTRTILLRAAVRRRDRAA